MNNYPPGVTGNEYQIAGPDFETEFYEYPCPQCVAQLMILGYQHQRWVACPSCGFQEDLNFDVDYDEPDDRR